MAHGLEFEISVVTVGQMAFSGICEHQKSRGLDRAGSTTVPEDELTPDDLSAALVRLYRRKTLNSVK
jgi:hypothetical protein